MFAENRFTNLPHFPLDIPWFPVQLAPQGAIGAIDSYIEYWGNGFFYLVLAVLSTIISFHQQIMSAAFFYLWVKHVLLYSLAGEIWYLMKAFFCYIFHIYIF